MKIYQLQIFSAVHPKSVESCLLLVIGFSLAWNYYRLCECVWLRISNANGEKGMSRMNGTKRKEAYELLAARDGEFCAMCGRAGSSKSLVVDHIDNNNRNNDPGNWDLLCRSCNAKKNPRGKAKPKNDSLEIHEAPSSEEINRNRKYEPKFREWLERLILKYSKVRLKEVISAGAEVTGASPVTIERYLEKACSFAGRYRVVIVDEVKHVEFKTWWSGK